MVRAAAAAAAAEGAEALDGVLGGQDDRGGIDGQGVVVAGEVEAAERVGGVVGREDGGVVDDDARAGAQLLAHLGKCRPYRLGLAQVDADVHARAGARVEVGFLARRQRDAVALRREGLGYVGSDLSRAEKERVCKSVSAGDIGTFSLALMEERGEERRGEERERVVSR